jgi:hypothetical protein
MNPMVGASLHPGVGMTRAEMGSSGGPSMLGWRQQLVSQMQTWMGLMGTIEWYLDRQANNSKI